MLARSQKPNHQKPLATSKALTSAAVVLLAGTIYVQTGASAQSSNAMISDGIINGPFTQAGSVPTDPLLISNPLYLTPSASSSNANPYIRMNGQKRQSANLASSNRQAGTNTGKIIGRHPRGNQNAYGSAQINNAGSGGSFTQTSDMTYAGGCSSGIPQGYTTNYNPYQDNSIYPYQPTINTGLNGNNNDGSNSVAPSPGGYNTNFATGQVSQGTNILPYTTGGTNPNNALGSVTAYNYGNNYNPNNTTGGACNPNGCNGYQPSTGGYGNSCGGNPSGNQTQTNGCNGFQAPIGGPDGLNGDTNIIIDQSNNNSSGCTASTNTVVQQPQQTSGNQNQGGDVPTSNSMGCGGSNGASGNPLTPEQYNPNGPPTRPSGTTTTQGSATGCGNYQTPQPPSLEYGNSTQGVNPLQTIVPH